MRKPLLIGLISVLIIIVLAVIFIGKYTDRLIDPYVRSLLETTKPMGHRIDYGKIRVNLLARYIIVRDVRVFPDSAYNTEHHIRLEVTVDDIRLTDFKVFEILFRKHLRIGDILVENPIVKFTLPSEHGEALDHAREKAHQEKKSQLLKQINLQRVILSGGSFQLIRNDVVLASSPDINFLGESLELVLGNNGEPMGYKYGNIVVDLTNIKLHSETGLYDMSLERFDISKADSTIVLEGFRMIPKYNKKEFSGKLAFQNDRFDVTIGEVLISHLGLERFLDGAPLEISSLRIKNLDADIYRDKNVAFNFDRFPVFYNESFLKIPFPLVIDSVLISDSRIQYGELAEERQEAGTITLEDFKLQSYHLTNLTEEDTIEQIMQLDVQAKVMGEGNLQAVLILQLEGNLRNFHCYGSVGAMTLAPLNSMLEPSINVKFHGGRVDRMTFDFIATDDISNGWMEFLYHDLDVEILRKDNKRWGIVSDLANTVAVSNNPIPGKELKIVEIGYERDKNKGIINYIWKTIQSGMVRTILPSKKHQINKKEAAEKNKLNRKITRTEKKIETENQKTEAAKAKEVETPKTKDKEKKKDKNP